MCSNSKCDMAGLINGPVGNIVGMGIKALVNGSPIGPRSESLRKQNGSESVQQFYENVEAHLKGAIRVLQPALEIKRMLSGDCKSADHERPAPISGLPILYYSPQNKKKSQFNGCPPRCCGTKNLTKRESEKSNSLKTRSRCSDSSTTKNGSQLKDSSSSVNSSKKCEKNAPKMCFSPMKREKTSKSSCTQENKANCCKASRKSSRLKQVCCMCQISLKDNNVLALLPCEHLFCYTCLAKAKHAKCQQCEKSFDMRNVTQIVAS